ncbi:hypothetical protein [Marinobacterium litorale]|uniref:hypothetical protein n=1 Tax=Marinobacterium litorale TaxID=404770 RepID=UPI000426FE21|nr:hypothetical protein [Marinobacterium litorale]
MKVCYILAYKSPSYIRSLSLINALKKTTWVELDLIINERRGMLRYFEVLSKLYKYRKNRDVVYIIGFRGIEIYWPVRWLVGTSTIALDALMSPYLSLSEERKFGWFGAMASYFYQPFEASVMKDANLVFTDTEGHSDKFSSCFNINESKVKIIPIGAIENSYIPKTLDEKSEFVVLYYGSFLPLHGVETLFKAILNLRGVPILFQLIGGGKKIERRVKYINKTFPDVKIKYERWVDYRDLINEIIPKANLILGGPFGGTPQASRVVTGKTVQALASSKACIVGAMNRNAYDFVDKFNCLLVSQNDHADLTDKIIWAFENRDKLMNIGINGKKLYQHHFDEHIITDRVQSALRSLTF